MEFVQIVSPYNIDIQRVDGRNIAEKLDFSKGIILGEIYVGRTEEFGDRDRKIIAQGNLEIGIFCIDGEFFAYENNCVHQGGPACQGKIINKVEEVIHETEKTAHGLKFSETDVHIVCPWHGYEYNVRNGRHPGNRNIRLRPFKVDVKDGEVYVLV